MLLTRNRFPLAPFGELRRELDRMLNHFADGFAEPMRGVRPFPALNIWEDGEKLYAEAEVPGLKMDDLEIFVVGRELTIKGRRSVQSDERLVVHRQERGVGEFVRVLTLPAEVDADKVQATLKDGVLSLVLPKTQAARARKIAVQAS